MNKLLKLQTVAIVVLLTAIYGVAAAVSTPAPAPPGSSLAQRVAQRKAERGTVLSPNDIQRLTSSCVNAQGKLRLQQTSDTAALNHRTQVYAGIDAKLWIAIGQLRLANKDTTALEKERLTLEDKTANFQSIASTYTQALADSLAIDCKADPTGFQALLDTARTYHDQLHQQSTDSRNFIATDVTNTLGGYVTGLQPKSTGAGSN